MGRHATVAGRMAATADLRGRVFTKIAREIMVSARSGSEPNHNPRLRMAIEKARDVNMPKENIERAIKKGAGELEGQSFEEITYEGYGPGGSAFLVQVLTDNRNRTNPELKRIFQKNHGHLAEQGSVAWMFQTRGVFCVSLGSMPEDQLLEMALDAGAEDVMCENGLASIFTDVAAFASVREALRAKGLNFEKSGLEQVPSTLVSLSTDVIEQAAQLIEKLEEYDDSQAVYHNCLFPD